MRTKTLATWLSPILFTAVLNAQTVDVARYAWETPAASGVTGADDLQTELQEEVQKVLDAGHLAPINVHYADASPVGYGETYFLYLEPGRIVTTLAAAYPYLTAAQQAAAKTYVRAELADSRFAPWGSYPMAKDVGARRELHPMDRIWGLPIDWGMKRPSVHTIYGLWLYGYRTGDWSAVQPRWSDIKSMYSARLGQADLYGTMSAHIAMVRLAARFGDGAAQASAYANLTSALQAGLDFAAVENNVWNKTPYWDSPYREFYTGRDDGLVYRGFQFLNLSGEMARYLGENLRDTVLARHNTGAAYFPRWWMIQAPYFTRLTGDEGIGQTSELFSMRMPVERYLLATEARTLRTYMSSAPTGLGDCYWLEALVLTIEAHGSLSWVDVRTAPPGNAPPVVTLTAPAAGATFTAPASVTMQAAASDSDGTVVKVEFYAGAALAGTSTAAPYTATAGPLAAGSYSLTAKAYDSGGASTTSAAVLITVNGAGDTQAPTAPASLAATASGSSQVNLSWAASTDNVGVKLYEIERNGTVLAATSATTAFADTGLAASTAYTYRVRAADAAGNRSTWSAAAAATTAPAPPVTNLLTNGGFETGSLSGWEVSWGVTVDSASAYSGKYGARIASNGRVDQQFPTKSGTTYYVMARLRLDGVVKAGTWGGVRIQVVNSGWADLGTQTINPGNAAIGAWKRVDLVFKASTSRSRIMYLTFSDGLYASSADDVVVSTSPIPPDGAAPLAAPTNLTATPSGVGVALAWTDASTNETGFQVERRSAGSFAPIGTTVANVAAYTDASPGAGTFVYRVRAVNATGTSAYSNEATATIAASNQPPSVALTNPASGATYTAPASFTLSASASDPDGTVVRVELYRGTTLLGPVTAAPWSFAVAGLAAGTYSFTARATDDRGASATSAPVTVTVSDPGGSAGGNLLTNGTFESGTLSGWTAGGATTTSADAHTGQWSARTTSASMEALFPTAVGQTYKATGWARIVSESGSDWGGFRVEAISYDWASLANTGPLTTATSGGGWSKFAITFTATTTRTRLEVGYFGGPGRQMVTLVDDLAAFQPGAGISPTLGPVISLASTTSVPTTMTFRAGADDADGTIRRLDWDFGDGVHAQTDAGTRVVGVPGTYTATVRAADDGGNLVSRTLTWSVTVPGSPVLTLSAEPPAVSASPTLSLAGTATGAPTRIVVSTDRDEVATAAGTASWSASVPLHPGRNRVLVQAELPDGRVATQERTLRYEPPGTLAVSAPVPASSTVGLYDPLTLTFAVSGSAATYPQFPFEAAPVRGLEFADGLTVDALFSPDGWATVYRRPAFLLEGFTRALKDGEEWLYPDGTATWAVRFAPPSPGSWKVRIEAREARGSAQSVEAGFTVAPASGTLNHGPVRVSARDSRYFEYGDGTPFSGTGHNTGASPELFSYDLESQLAAMGSGNQDLLRWWIGGNVWGSAWSAWRSRTLSFEGYLPATGLSLASAYGDGIAAMRLDAQNPLMFNGWNTGHAPLVPGRTYRIRVRWRTEGVTGPATSGQPFGVCVKFTGWPEPGQTGSLPVLVAHVAGHTPWHVAEGTFTATGNIAPNLAVILENAMGGAAYVDQVQVYEWTGAAQGVQVLRGSKTSSHLRYDGNRAAGLDAALLAAQARGVSLKLVISEKGDWLLNRIGPDGLPDTTASSFFNGGGSMNQKLHEFYWRYLSARYGAYRSVHSWELVNEEAPGFDAGFVLTDLLAEKSLADGNPHLASTSTWATLATDAWKNPGASAITHADFHAYARSTGWLGPKDDLANDSARFVSEYGAAAAQAAFGKPVIWGEAGIDGTAGSDLEDPGLASDTAGVWLHKMVWVRTGPAAVVPLYWYSSNIFARGLHSLYGNWRRFMHGVPLTNGRYVDAAAQVSTAALRVFGQKDVSGGAAHLWIDNPQHTWRRVVDGAAPVPASGTVTVAMGSPGAAYTAAWCDTSTGLVTRKETVTADASGSVVLTVTGLAADTAVRLSR